MKQNTIEVRMDKRTSFFRSFGIVNSLEISLLEIFRLNVLIITGRTPKLIKAADDNVHNARSPKSFNMLDSTCIKEAKASTVVKLPIKRGLVIVLIVPLKSLSLE